jgi:hypothetical protein
MEQLRALQGPRDFSLFAYHCLTKLGRTEEARDRLDQFRRCFLPKFADPAKGQAPPAGVNVDSIELGPRVKELLDPNSLGGSLLQDLYAAEVFLSLDAAEDGEVFFRTALGQAAADPVRLSRALVLGQILLLRKKHEEYAELSTQTVAPLLTRMLKPMPAGGQGDFLDTSSLAEFVGELALLPLGVPSFLARLPDKQRQAMSIRWEKLRGKANDGGPLVDFVLRGLYQTLGQEKERQEAAARLKNRPAGSTFLPLEDEAGNLIAPARRLMRGRFGWR